MNKKQMLKEQKRLKQERKEVETLFKDDKDVFKVFKIALGVILFIGLAYVLLNIFNGNWNIFTQKNTNKTEIQTNMLIAGTLFNKEEDEYLVLAYDMSDDKYNFYGALASNYNGTSHLYYLDLSSGFNTKIVAEKAVVSNDLEKLKLSGPTLLVMKGNRLTKVYAGEKNIVDYFVQK